MASTSPGSSISSAHLAAALSRAQGRPSALPLRSSRSGLTPHLASPFDLQLDSPLASLQPVVSVSQQPATPQSERPALSPTGTVISSDALSRALSGAMASTEIPTQWAQVYMYYYSKYSCY